MKDKIHEWFGLGRAEYLTIPRSVLQSMPDEWQKDFVALLDKLDEAIDWRPQEGRYWVELRDKNGRYRKDSLRDYGRGRRIVAYRPQFAEKLIKYEGRQGKIVQLSLPKGDIILADGRSLHRDLTGVDLRKIAGNEITRKGILDQGRWYHTPSRLGVIASMDMTQFGALLHVSMSYPDHDPIWDEIKMVRKVFFPTDIDVMMMLPKEEDYVNVHRHAFHLIQTPERWGIR